MKKTLLKKILKYSKLVFYGVMMQFLAITLLWANEGNAQKYASVKDVKVDISLDDALITRIFKEIESQSELNFFYDRSYINSKIRFDLHERDISVYNILLSISEKADIEFRRINNTINVSKKRDRGASKKNNSKVVLEEIEVNGVVTSYHDGSPLPGVNIVVMGTSQGTITDANGRYKLRVSEDATLIFSFIGYERQEEPVNSRDVIDIALMPDIEELSELVVLGYYTQQKADVTGAIGTVDTEELEKQVNTSLADKIQGRIAGVTVRSAGGQPGKTANIQIRGVNNFNDSGPLWVIDGLQTTDTRDFNPNDVESIQVIKDASAAALYGTRGANGVIIVTTKRGQEGPMKIDFNAKYGVQNFAKTYDLMNRNEWASTIDEIYSNAGQAILPASDPGYNAGVDTDWQDAFIQTGILQEYDLSLSGGNENAQYRISGNYFNNKGAVIDTEFDRYTTRINGGLEKGRFKIAESALLSYTKSSDLAGNPFNDAIRMFPVIPVYDPNTPTGFGIGSVEAPTLASNPVAQQLMNSNTVESFRMQGTISGEFTIFDFLKYKLNLGLEYNNSNFKNFRKEGQIFFSQPEPFSSLGEDRDRYISKLVENTLSFNKSFGEHNVSALFGVSQLQTNLTSVGASVRDLPRNSEGDYFDQIGQGGTAVGYRGSETETGLLGYIGHVDYDYAGKYLLSFNIRRDGSSKFGPNNKYAVFPSASVGWRISDEAFFSNVLVVNDLKIRASFGSLGSDAIGDYQYQAYINTLARYILGRDQQVASGSTQRELVNTNIRWNDVIKTNIGVDVGLLNNAITATVDYYISKSDNMLIYVPINWALGYAGDPPPINAASMENRGIEVSLAYSKREGDFTFEVRGNLTTINNEVIDLGTPNNALLGAGNARTEAGRSLGEFYVRLTDGIFQSADEIEDSAQPDAQPGDPRFKDINGRDENGDLTGMPDGQINDDDRAFAGSPWAKWQAGLNFSAAYRNFDFSMFWNGRYGNKIYNSSAQLMSNTADVGNYMAGLEPWTTENRSNTTPEAELGAGGIIRGDTDRFIEDGSFLRLNNLQLGYTVPSNLMDRIGVSTLRVYLTGQNLITFTDYTGLDPDIGGDGILAPGFDNNSFPNMRSYLVGVQIGF